jgi:hypothetical protein
MKVTYGYSITGEDDYFINLAERSIQILRQVLPPGAWLCDSISICACPSYKILANADKHYIVRYWPSWLPGGGFKRKAKLWAQQFHEQATEPHLFVKRNLVRMSRKHDHSAADERAGSRDSNTILHFTTAQPVRKRRRRPVDCQWIIFCCN